MRAARPFKSTGAITSTCTGGPIACRSSRSRRRPRFPTTQSSPLLETHTWTATFHRRARRDNPHYPSPLPQAVLRSAACKAPEATFERYGYRCALVGTLPDLTGKYVPMLPGRAPARPEQYRPWRRLLIVSARRSPGAEPAIPRVCHRRRRRRYRTPCNECCPAGGPGRALQTRDPPGD